MARVGLRLGGEPLRSSNLRRVDTTLGSGQRGVRAPLFVSPRYYVFQTYRGALFWRLEARETRHSSQDSSIVFTQVLHFVGIKILAGVY